MSTRQERKGSKSLSTKRHSAQLQQQHHHHHRLQSSTSTIDRPSPMTLTMYLAQVHQGILRLDASKLCMYLKVHSKQTDNLLIDSNEHVYKIEEECRKIFSPVWTEVVFHHIMACRAVATKDYSTAYTEQNATVNAFLREFINMNCWSLDVLYMLNEDLRTLAIQADKQAIENGDNPSKLEDCARTLNKSFTQCITDRSPMDESRKWGTYYMIALLFKTYFKLKSHNLCKSIIRATTVATLPRLEEFPLSHQVMARYYLGVLAFFNDDFKKAEADLQFACDNTPKQYQNNRRLILHYLIPTKLVDGFVPSNALLEETPEIHEIYGPLTTAIKTGNVQIFDEVLSKAAPRLVSLGTYLTVERARNVVVRTLFNRVYKIMDGSSRLPISVFQSALAFVKVELEEDEVECMIAQMIYQIEWSVTKPC
ncbi:COP9 signalosome (CSN) subunit [Lunasporangiospora selenospora]|uniref:COP9 signalosome (CSN) subunit n=1 Tax=Lunasporangiospora selenospora TaxID=979761 RepID=A0A9P6FU81_9FUNG|nr:COP9 signalosome (CSN) subunit [Lunasporangiospora selenospora]